MILFLAILSSLAILGFIFNDAYEYLKINLLGQSFQPCEKLNAFRLKNYCLLVPLIIYSITMLFVFKNTKPNLFLMMFAFHISILILFIISKKTKTPEKYLVPGHSKIILNNFKNMQGTITEIESQISDHNLKIDIVEFKVENKVEHQHLENIVNELSEKFTLNAEAHSKISKKIDVSAYSKIKEFKVKRLTNAQLMEIFSKYDLSALDISLEDFKNFARCKRKKQNMLWSKTTSKDKYAVSKFDLICLGNEFFDFYNKEYASRDIKLILNYYFDCQYFNESDDPKVNDSNIDYFKRRMKKKVRKSTLTIF